MRNIYKCLRPRATLVFGIAFFAIANLFGQSKIAPLLKKSPIVLAADSLSKIGRKTAIDFLNSKKADLEAADRRETFEFVAVLFASGKQKFREKKYDVAFADFWAAAELLKKIDPANTQDLVLLLDFQASCQNYQNRNIEAIRIFEKMLALQLSVFGENSAEAARIFQKLAASTGDYGKSVDYALKAIRSLKNAGLTNHVDFAAYHLNLGNIHGSHGNYEKSAEFMEMALPIFESQLGESAKTALCISMLGSIYVKLNQPEKSLEYQMRAAAMFEKVEGSESQNLPAMFWVIGTSYNACKNPKKAIEYSLRGQYFGAKTGEHPLPEPEFCFNFCKAYRMLGDHDRALAYADTCLMVLKYVKSADPKTLEHPEYLWNALLQKSSVLAEKFRKTPDPKLLVEADELLKDAKNIVFSRISEFHSERSKMAFYKQAVANFDQTIRTNLQLFEATADQKWLVAAFEYSENGKSLLLFQQVLENKTRRQFSVPPILTDEENDLRQSIVEVEKSLFELGENAAAAEKDVLADKIFNLKNQQENLREKIKTVCPDYFSAASEFPKINLKNVQDGLSENQGLLEFFTGDSAVYAFLLRRDTLVFRQIPKNYPLENQVKTMRTAITQYFTSPEKTPEIYLSSANDYAETAFDLYQNLLAPFGNLLPSELTIVPDGVLNYLPFEALLTEKSARPDRFHLHKYFSKNTILSYAYSISMQNEMESNPNHHVGEPQKLLAIAPFFDGTTVFQDSLIAMRNRTRADLSPLPFTGEEVFKIAKITDGLALTGKEATKTEFLRLASGFQILHLAQHAKANDRAGDYSFLAFPPPEKGLENEKLYVSEIDGLRLNADLVTLSACETGLGELHRGEGVVSIARAFVSAGARSLVQSLWVVNDSQTQKLMSFFYQNLKRGLPKDAALAAAKNEYLREFRGEEAHPYFWAGFIFLGEKKAISGF